MRLTKRQLKRIIREEYTRLKRQGLIIEGEEQDPAEETEDEYYDRLAAEYEEMEDGRYEREDAMYRKQIGESRRRRRMLRESLHSHMDANIADVVLHASHLVAEEYGDITVQDVLETIQSMSEQEVLGFADPMSYDTLEYNEYFVSTIRQIDYEMVVDKMYELVQLGELADGYEDFFSLPGV